MAVKVINIVPAGEVAKRVICKNCGATLEYVPNDLSRYDGKDISGGPDGKEWIVCPNCGKQVVVRSW